MTKLTFLGEEHEIDGYLLQMEDVATDLVFLLKHSGLSRTELADKLNCPKSRITRILSGDENLTIKTITQVAEALGYAFDVVFYNKDYPRPKQPWQIDRENKTAQAIVTQPPISSINFTLQHSIEVLNDFHQGHSSEFYLKIENNALPHQPAINLEANILPPTIKTVITPALATITG